MATIRSTEVFACLVCGARTNCINDDRVPSVRGVTGRMIWGDNRSWTVCPNAETCWHHELEAKLQWLRFPHPATVVRVLTREITSIRKDPRNMIRNDLEGVDAETTATRRVNITFARRPDASLIRCTHHRDRDGQIIETTGVPVEPPFR